MSYRPHATDADGPQRYLPMHFYCYSKFGEANHKTSLGEADYSYYFVLKAYKPILEKLGTVEVVDSLTPGYLSQLQPALEGGEDVYLFVFAPPHKIPSDLPGKVIPVFAWEYSNLPIAERISDPEDCWRARLLNFGQALTISSYAKKVVRDEIGADFLIESIPAPITFEKNATNMHDTTSVLTLSPEITVIDSRDFCFGADSANPLDEVTHPFHRRGTLLDAQETMNIDLGSVSSGAQCVGFYPPEGWGAWSTADCCWVVFPHDMHGGVKITVTANAYGKNVSKTIFLMVGHERIPLELNPEMTAHTFEVLLDNPTNFLRFQDIDHSTQGQGNDTRFPGIGVSTIQIQSLLEAPHQYIPEIPPLVLNQPVYTSIFNPKDNRKNWEDILTAFCFAFRDNADATLVLKMTCGALDDFLDDLFQLLCQLQPFDCRIVAIQGYLPENDVKKLREATKYIVNASHGEGQCLPLVEFMAEGTPAIAPDHTALADYISPDCAFIVSSAPEPTFWPHEPDQNLTTLWFRPDWESLRDAYTKSHDFLSSSPEEYGNMSLRAVAAIEKYCSEEVGLKTLEKFLITVKEAWGPSS